MATQTYSISVSKRATISGTLSSAPTTATLTNTYTTSSTNDTTTISGTLTLTVNVAKGSGYTVSCGATIDNAKVLVNGTARVNVSNRSASVTSSTSSTKSNSTTLGTYSVAISRTHAAQSISVRLEQTGLTAHNWYAEELDSGGKTSTVTVSARPSYTVSYAANGGSSTPSAQTKWYGEAITLSGAISRTGYTFAGWKWSGNNTVYSASTSWNAANASGTMTAQWTANTYSVKYNANGGSGTMSNSTHTYDTAKALTTNAFTRSKYLFKGWATTASGGVVYTNGQSVKNLTTTKNGTVNLYAVWEYQYKKPTFSSLTAWRTKDTATGGVYEKDDSGTNADVSVMLNAGQKKSTANGSFENISTTVQFFYKAHSASSYPSTPFSTQTTTASGATLTAHISDQLNTETQYDIRVDAYITESSADSASYTTFVSTAFFLVDMTDTGIAFGQACTEEGFWCNMDAKFKRKVTLDRNSDGIYYAGTNNTTQMIRFLDNTVDEWGHGMVIGGGASELGNGGGLMIIGAGESPNYVQEGLYNGGYSSGSELLALTSDERIEVYSGAQNGYASAKKTVFDSLGFINTSLGITSSGLTYAEVYAEVTRTDAMAQDSTLTESSTDEAWMKAYIKAICAKYPSRGSCVFKGRFNPNSAGWFEVYIYNTSTTSGGLPQYSVGRLMKYNLISAEFGTTNYSFVYRGNNDVAECTIASGYTNYASGVTPKVYRNGNICMFKWAMKVTTSYVMNDALKTICTIPAGYRPKDEVHLLCQGSGTMFFYAHIATDGSVQVARLRDVGNGNSSWSTASTSMWFPITATYICP